MKGLVMAYDESVIGVDRETIVARNTAELLRRNPEGDSTSTASDESNAINFPTREQCIKELEAWEALKAEADRIVDEFAAKVQHDRAMARAYCQRPPVTFTYDIPRGKGMSYIAEGLGTLISRSIERVGWSLETKPLPNGDLRIAIS